MCNLGVIDSVLRAVVGTTVVAWGIATVSLWELVGVYLLGTAIINFCPLYAILKINSGCKSVI